MGPKCRSWSSTRRVKKRRSWIPLLSGLSSGAWLGPLKKGCGQERLCGRGPIAFIQPDGLDMDSWAYGVVTGYTMAESEAFLHVQCADGACRLAMRQPPNVVQVDWIDYVLQTERGTSVAAHCAEELPDKLEEVRALVVKSRSGVSAKVTSLLSVPFDSSALVPMVRLDNLAIVSVPRQHVLDCVLKRKRKKGRSMFIPPPEMMATRANKRKASANASKGSRPTSRHKHSEDLSGNESDNDLLPVGGIGDVADDHDKFEVQRQNRMLVDASAASSLQSTRVDGVNEETRQTKATTYRPTSIEKQIHDKIGHLDHQGKDPQSILEYEPQSRGSLFLTAPPVLRGAYDFGFKIGGLSVMHFVSVARTAAMDNDDPGMNMTDFSRKNCIKPVRNSPSYDELKDALENLRQFGSTFYNEETVAVLRAAQRFIESYGRSCTPDRDTTRRLVFWLNTKLCQFRGVVLAEGLDEAVRIQAEFSHQDALLTELMRDQHEEQIATMKAQLEAKSSSGNSAHTSGSDVRSAKQSGTPKSVLRSLPKQGKLTLCMKYVSKEGCDGGESPDKCFSTKRAHFRPKKLAAEVKEHIVNRFGGLAPEFADL